MSEYGAYKRETKKLLRSYPKKMGRGGSKNKRYRNIKPRSVFFLGKTPEMKILGEIGIITNNKMECVGKGV